MRLRSKPAKRATHKRVCDLCSRKFLTYRADTAFCSAACKQRAYRERKRAAEEERA